LKKTAAQLREKTKNKYPELDAVLQQYKGREGVLIKALQEAQEMYGYLPREILVHMAYELDVPLSEIYSVVSFYSLFKTKAAGRCHLEVCSGTACYVQGMEELLEYLAEKLSLRPGGVTADEKFSLSTSNCMGVCSAAPVLKIDGELHGEMTLQRLQQLIKEHADDE
jgi:NADH:ubiquinone oxidoreductase subunit E